MNPHLPPAYTYVNAETRRAYVEQSPRVVFIEVTNHCNLRCQTCPRTFGAFEEPKTLSWENFRHIVGQFPEMQRAVLHGIGEPLINQNLPSMIRYLKSRGMTVLFNTNATLLDEKWARALIASGLDELRCSLDAAEPHTYAQIRGLPLFPQITQNLKRFTELQRALHISGPQVSLWMTGMRENIGELPDLVRLAAQVGVRQVYLQRLVYFLDHPQAPRWLKSEHALFDDHDAPMDRVIAAAEKVGRELGVTLKASGATDPRHMLRSAHSPRPWADCLRLWTSAYVTANGNCLPCCMSPFATTDYASLKLGNLFERPFGDIWNNAQYQSWRRALLGDDPYLPCRGCGVHWSL